MKLRLLLIIAGFSFVLSCKNEIDINAPYRDIAIVYAFLDQNDPVQYIRIQKVYQNDATQTTAEGAQISDSLYFDSLVVTLTNRISGTVFPCFKVDSIPKDSGFFSTAKNILYAVSIPKANAENEEYALDIFYPKGNIRFSSITRLVKDPIIENRKVVLRPDLNNHNFSMRYTTGLNAYLYDLKLRFHYREYQTFDTTTLYEDKFVDYSLKINKKVKPSSQYDELTSSKSYYEFLKSQFKFVPGKYRKVLNFELITYGGSSEFQNLNSLSSPNISIVQKNPTYSNINNGIGIFSSRNKKNLVLNNDVNTTNLLNNNLEGFKP
jgi:hypothetical protein